jgi:ATP/ADP translocase
LQPTLSARNLAGLAVMGFLILASYSIARPATESLFLEAFGKEGLPRVWLAVAAGIVLAVFAYNRYAATVPLPRLFMYVALASGAVLTALLLAFRVWPVGCAFLLYVWKDVYIVVLVEIFWSYANASFRASSATWLYGFFLLVGQGGSYAGNRAVGWLATGALGTTGSLWLVLPLLLGAVLGLGSVRGVPIPERPKAEFHESLRVFRTSHVLLLLTALIGVVQLCINLIDYQFSGAVHAAFADADERTRAIGAVYGRIDIGALALQLACGPILKTIGVHATLLAIPACMALTLAAYWVAPSLQMLAWLKVASKVFDYSLFRAAKEILYLPMSYREKTQGKAIVDMLTYRVAKAGASFLLLLLIYLQAQGFAHFLTALLLIAWLWLTWRVTRWHRRALRSVP